MARGLAVWALFELPFLVVVGAAVQVLFDGGLDSETAWRVASWCLAATGVVAVGGILGVPRVWRDDVAVGDLALPILGVALLAVTAALAAQELYSWLFWASGVGIGIVLAIAAIVSLRRADARTERDVEEAKLDRRDHERRLAAHGDTQRVV